VCAQGSLRLQSLAVSDTTLLASFVHPGTNVTSSVFYDRVDAFAYCGVAVDALLCTTPTSDSDGHAWALTTNVTRDSVDFAVGMATLDGVAAIGHPTNNQVLFFNQTQDAAGALSWTSAGTLSLNATVENSTLTGLERFGYSVSLSSRFVCACLLVLFALRLSADWSHCILFVAAIFFLTPSPQSAPHNHAPPRTGF